VSDEDSLKVLMLRGLRGDAAAYRQLLLGVAADLRSYFRHRILVGPDEIEDLVQETLLAIHVKRETYDASQSVTGWMFAIARHKLIDRYRRDGRRPTIALDEVSECGNDADFERELARRDVAVLLDELPTKQAAAIRRVKLEGLSVEEAASLTGQSVSAVKVGIHRGLKKLLSRFARSKP
jgi:RNA polymerase sigma-70 factor (ECF subfamily)